MPSATAARPCSCSFHRNRPSVPDRGGHSSILCPLRPVCGPMGFKFRDARCELFALPVLRTPRQPLSFQLAGQDNGFVWPIGRHGLIIIFLTSNMRIAVFWIENQSEAEKHPVRGGLARSFGAFFKDAGAGGSWRSFGLLKPYFRRNLFEACRWFFRPDPG